MRHPVIMSSYWALYYCKILSESRLNKFFKVLATYKVSTAILSLFGRAKFTDFRQFLLESATDATEKLIYGEDTGPRLTFYIM